MRKEGKPEMTKPKNKRKSERKPEVCSEIKGATQGAAVGSVTGGAGVGLSALSPTPPSTCGGGVTARSPGRPSLLPEIKNMMYAAGDASCPLNDTAQLVEEIVHTKLIHLVLQLQDTCAQRGARQPGLEDVIFTLRKDKQQLCTLLRLLAFRDLRSRTLKNVQEDQLTTDGTLRRRAVCTEVLSALDHSGELNTLLSDPKGDAAYMERLERVERRTRIMEPAQYAEFAECRQVTFGRKLGRFRDWLDQPGLELKTHGLFTECITHIATNILTTLVEEALLVKRDAESWGLNTSPHCHPHIVARAIPSPPGPEMKTSPTSPEGASSPSPSPSSTGTLATESQALRGRPSKRRKVSTVSMDSSSGALLPWHVREVIRRHGNTPNPMAPFTGAYRGTGPHILL
uniref:transcription initiation protein SPT3 homolog isoform X2 n=1 Tax=Myxine glutinosa TaxID=7769 RepID=UPI00358F36E3